MKSTKTNYFSSCKNDEERKQRIKNILESIRCCNSIAVEYDSYHDNYYIHTPQLKVIDRSVLSLSLDKNDWNLNVGLYFGYTQTQAKSLYTLSLDISKLKMLGKNKGGVWVELKPNFHVGFMDTTNFVEFESEIDIETYIKYWIEHINWIEQCEKNEVEKFLKKLKKANIIIYNDAEEKELEDKYILYESRHKGLNICPGFYIIFKIPSEVAVEKDNKDGELEELISKKIKKGLSIIDLDWKQILK